MNLEVEITIDASPGDVWRTIEPIERHVEWMADAVSITFTSTERRGVGTTFDCLTRVGPLRTTDRMRVTEWVPRERMGIEHVGVVTGRGHFALVATRPGSTNFLWTEELTFPWWMGGSAGALAAKPILRASVAAQPAQPEEPRREFIRTDVTLSLRRVTTYAMSVAGIQTLGTELTLDVVREADALGYDAAWVAEANAAEAMSLLGAISQAAPHLGLGTGVLATATAHPTAARDGRGHAAAARRRSQRVPRRRDLVTGGRRPVARRRIHRPAHRAGAGVRHPRARVPER